MKKIYIVYAFIIISIIIIIILFFMNLKNITSNDSNDSIYKVAYTIDDDSKGYYESIYPEEPNTYNILKPKIGYERITISEDDINSLDYYKNNIKDIFSILLVSDEFITSIDSSDISIVDNTFYSGNSIVSFEFKIKDYNDYTYILYVDKELKIILYKILE